MKKLAIFLLVLLTCVPAFAVDITSTVILDGSVVDRQNFVPQVSGDIWAKYSDLAFLTADFDYQFGREVSKINVAQIKFIVSDFDVVVGRQQIGWGSGYVLNPIDIINSRPIGSVFDPSFIRDGRDAVSVSGYFLGQSKVEMIYAGPLSEVKAYDASTEIDQRFNEDFAVKVKDNFADFDVAGVFINKGERSYSANIEPSDRVLGLEISGTLPFNELGFWMETAHYTETGKDEYLLGTDYYFGDYHTTVEYYKNGFGTADKTVYDANLLFRGRLMGSDYLIPTLSYTVDERLTLTGFSFWNINDGGTSFGGVIDYFYNDNVELILMPLIISGSDDSEMGQQVAVIGNYVAQFMVRCVF